MLDDTSPLVKVENLKMHFPIYRGILSRQVEKLRPLTESVSPSIRARPLVWWAKADAENRPLAVHCCAFTTLQMVPSRLTATM